MPGGIRLPDGLLCLPAELTVLSYDRIQDESEIRLRIREGKFHQVKRMMEAAGCPVLFLKRLSMGPLVLDETLKPGNTVPLRIQNGSGWNSYDKRFSEK